MTITPATLPAALKAAKPGDTLVLSGPFGDLDPGVVSFSPAITLSSDLASPATLTSLRLQGVTGLHFHGFGVSFTPGPSTVDWSHAVSLDTCADIAFDGFKITGGTAVTGIPEDATDAQIAADTTGNIIGRPAARGIDVLNSHDIAVTNSEIIGFHRQIIMSSVQRMLIEHNVLHGRRTTSIAGTDLIDVTVNGNVIFSASPWRWGLPNGDHADMLAYWANPGQTGTNTRLKITNNIMAQLDGDAILGMWMSAVPGSPFTDVEISGNLILVGNIQGIMLWDTVGGKIANNTLVQAPLPSMTAEQLAKQFPTIILRAEDGGPTTGIVMTDNALGVAIDDRSGGANPPTRTTFTTPTKDSGVTEIRAWLADHPDMAALAAPLLPAPAPVPAPPAADPRDAQIAALKATLVQVKALATSGRKAKAKDTWFDQILKALAAAV